MIVNLFPVTFSNKLLQNDDADMFSEPIIHPPNKLKCKYIIL